MSQSSQVSQKAPQLFLVCVCVGGGGGGGRHAPMATHLLVQAIGNGSCCGLVDDSQHIETRDGSSIFCGLTLGVVEVGWHGHNSICHSLQNAKNRSILESLAIKNIYIYLKNNKKEAEICWRNGLGSSRMYCTFCWICF